MARLIRRITSSSTGIILAGVLLPVTTCLADTASVPHIFVSGTTASAAEVNANFSELETAINGSDTQINSNTTAAQTNATDIATLQAARGISVISDTDIQAGALLRWDLAGGQVTILSATGYMATVRMDGNAPVGGSSVYFITNDCSGQAYMAASDFQKLQGEVHRTAFADPVTMRYIPKNAVDVSTTTYSEYTNSACVASTATHTVVQVYPNDPVVTGFENTLFDSNLHYFSY